MADTTAARISLMPDGPLLVVAIQRPPDNLIDVPLAAELRDVLESLRDESPFRALIITGAPTVTTNAGGGDGDTSDRGDATEDGPAPFSRGTDTQLWTDARAATSAEQTGTLLDRYRCASVVASLPFPVIAAIEGDAFDQGLELALAADIRVASQSARFRMGQVASGAIPWDGGTQRLPRVTGPAYATDLILTGRTINAHEAQRMGLVNRVTPPGEALDAAREIAGDIIKAGPIATRYAKEAVYTGADMSLDHGILLETDLTMILQTTKDRDEGIRSFLERRDPEFTGE